MDIKTLWSENVNKIFTSLAITIILGILTSGIWLYTDYKITKNENIDKAAEIEAQLAAVRTVAIDNSAKIVSITIKTDSTNQEMVYMMQDIKNAVSTLQYVVEKNNKKMKNDLDEIKKFQTYTNGNLTLK